MVALADILEARYPMLSRTHRNIVILIIFVLLVAPLAAQAPESKSLAPFWTLDLEGNEITETIFSPYQLTLVNIWATFCSPCLQEMPALAELRNEFAS
ncbi:MAG: hypothetical protein PHX79_05455, partial [Sphaerochaetaceae bacterium]|nr:hypothetical protein [Sphaerochaetaceae bacterium]